MPELFVRDVGNPLLGVDWAPRLAEGGVLVSNPGVVRWAGRLLMAVRVDLGRVGDPGIDGTAVVFLDSVDDGTTWRSDALPSIDRAVVIGLLGVADPHRDAEAEVWRAYDPRLTVAVVDGLPQLLLSLAIDTVHGLRPALLVSSDGREWGCAHLGAPDDRNHVVFPEPIDGAWWRLTRPMHDYGGPALGAGGYEIWAQRSPDLRHWGGERVLVAPSDFASDVVKVGPGAPPLRTDAGWLCLVHVVTPAPLPGRRGWEEHWDRVYATSAVLLDLEDPSLVLGVASAPILAPAADYERHGYRNDVVFVTGAEIRNGWVIAYYGAADSVVARARAPIDRVLEAVLSGTRSAPGSASG